MYNLVFSDRTKTSITKSLQKNPRFTMHPTMYVSKKSYTKLLIDLGQTTEPPLKILSNVYLFF